MKKFITIGKNAEKAQDQSLAKDFEMYIWLNVKVQYQWLNISKGHGLYLCDKFL